MAKAFLNHIFEKYIRHPKQFIQEVQFVIQSKNFKILQKNVSSFHQFQIHPTFHLKSVHICISFDGS